MEIIINEKQITIPQEIENSFPIYKGKNSTAKIIKTGEKYNSLTILYRTINKGKNAQYLTICDCGNFRAVLGTQLRKQEIISCHDCAMKNLFQRFKEQEIGNKYGTLTVTDYNKKLINGAFKYLATVKCDCGVEEEVEIQYLRNGRINTCSLERKHRINDFIGKRFDKLIVIADSGMRSSNNSVIWLCQCDCNNFVYRTTKSLKSDNYHSCGCGQMYQQEEKLKKEFIGKQFDNLTVLALAPTRRYNQRDWICRCICGNEVICSTTLLHSDSYKSCLECYRKSRRLPLGQKIGYITTLAYLNDNNNKLIGFHCYCENCKKEVDLSYNIVHNNLYRKNNFFSCGCIDSPKSKGEEIIKIILDENNYHYLHDKQYFTDLYMSKGGIGRYDFIIFDEEENPIWIIEFDGEQHFKETRGNWKNDTTLEERQNNDKIKNQYAKSKNIPIVRIPYTEINNLSLSILFGDKYLFKGDD